MDSDIIKKESCMFWFYYLIGWLLAIAMLLITIHFVTNRQIDWIGVGICVVLAIIAGAGGYYAQTHRSVPVQNVGVAKNSITQKLSDVQSAGLVEKPFFGRVYTFPASNSTQVCTEYTPSLKGSYGITVKLCFYINTSGVDWKREIQETGSLEASKILEVWRNSVVSQVATTFKTYTPEDLSLNRETAVQNLHENTQAWFAERGIELVSVSMIDWNFTSVDVGNTFDESILSQRKITEQTALFEASQISRERELFEIETDKLVAQEQHQMLQEMGFEGQEAIQFLYLKHYEELGTMPSLVITGNAPVSIQP